MFVTKEDVCVEEEDRRGRGGRVTPRTERKGLKAERKVDREWRCKDMEQMEQRTESRDERAGNRD